MKQYHTHACLISAQATPNLTPLLDEHIKPKQLWMFVTETMKEQAVWIQKSLHGRGIQIQIYPLSDTSDLSILQDELLLVLSAFADTDWAFNITGGTKMMALAALSVAQLCDKDSFYVEQKSDSIFVLNNKPQQKKSPYALNNKLKLNVFLAAYGHAVLEQEHRGLSEPERLLVDKLVKNVSTLGSALKAMNFYAAEAKRTGSLAFTPEDAKFDDPNFAKLLDVLVDHALIKQEHGKKYRYINHAARTFINGGWLEQYTYDCLQNIQVQDSAMSIQIEGVKNPDHNELDVACLKNNNLYLIECKTNNFQAAVQKDKGQDTLYKLQALSKIGGNGTKSMLVTYVDLRSEDKQRADTANIKVVSASELKDLKGILKNWLQ